MKIAIASVVVFLVLGCSPSKGKEDLASQSKATCADVIGLQDLSSSYLLFSESHGTNESIDFFKSTICNQLNTKARILVALEYPDTGNDGLSTFLKSDGSITDIQTLFDSEHSFWRNSNDGRSSRAFLDLLDFLRMQKLADANFDVRGFQPTDYDREALKPKQAAYSLAMGENLNRLSQLEGFDQVIALIGSFHGKRAEVNMGPFSINTAAMYIEDQNLQSLSMITAGGTSWNCVGKTNSDGKFEKECGIKETGKSKWAKEFDGQSQIKLGEFRRGFDGLYYVGTTSASKPAAMEIEQ